MRKSTWFISGSLLSLTCSLFASTASAHIELVAPSPRYTLPANKACPCGEGDSSRVCDVTAAESTDPNRSENISTFEAGSTITVQIEEYIDHAGRMRVAFDPDGADLADFNANVLLDEPDPLEPSITMANPRVWEFQVQLPMMECDNCTLQVIQAMHGDTENPVADPAPLSTYYTCADIRLVAPGTDVSEGGGDDGDMMGAGGSAIAAGGGGAGGAGDGEEEDTSVGGSATAAGGTTGSSAAGRAPANVDSEASVDSDASGDDGGCSLRPSGAGGALGWALAALAGVGLYRRRRASAR